MSENTEKASAYELLKSTKIQWALFVDNYVLTFNRTEASKYAGYKFNGPNQATMHSQQGAKLLANPKIRAAIEERLEAATMGKREILGRLADQASIDANAMLMIGPKGTLQIDWKTAKEVGLLRHVKTIRQTTRGVTVEFIDRQKALELLGRHHRLFSDVVTMGDKPDQTAKQLSDADLLAIARGPDPDELSAQEVAEIAEQLGLNDEHTEESS